MSSQRCAASRTDPRSPHTAKKAMLRRPKNTKRAAAKHARSVPRFQIAIRKRETGLEPATFSLGS